MKISHVMEYKYLVTVWVIYKQVFLSFFNVEPQIENLSCYADKLKVYGSMYRYE